MLSFRLPTREQVIEYLQAKSTAFLHFAYNKENSTYFGRNATSWGKIALFYLVFYCVVGGFFAIHLLLFTCHAPEPGPGVRPRNFGRFAYPNYPNSPLKLLVIPRKIDFDGGSTSMPDDDRKRFEKLVYSARAVGADSVCTNSALNYGYSVGQPCAFIHVAKVFRWNPEAITPSYSSRSFFEVQCHSNAFTRLNIGVRVSPPGIPLNYNNSTDRRFPYNDQENYIVPLMSVVFDLNTISLSRGTSTSLTINCALNISTIPDLPNVYSKKAISELYEVPRSAAITMSLKN